MSISSRSSPRKPVQQDFQAASAAVELEYNAVKRLKRLSIGNSLNFDPDLPSTDSYFLDNNQLKKNYDPDLHRSKSILSTNSTSSLGRSFDSYLSDDENDTTSGSNDATANDFYRSDDDDNGEGAPYSDAATADTNRVNLSKLSLNSVQHEDIDFNDDNVDFLDLDPDSSFGDSDIIWVPATAHPKLSPENFRKHVQNTVDGIQTKLQRSGSIKSSLNRETSVNDLQKALRNSKKKSRGRVDAENSNENAEEEEEDDDFVERDKENLIFTREKERERGGLQIRKPSLKELTVQLETLSKRAGLDNNDAVTLARSLSTRSIGITKLEKEVYSQSENDDNNDQANNIDQIPNESMNLNRARSRKLLLRNNLNKTRESLFIKDDLFDDDDDEFNDSAEIDDDLIEMNYKSNDGGNYNNSSSEFVSNLKRGRWTNYRRQQNFSTPSNLPNLPNVPQKPRKGNANSRSHPHVHVYKDIQKIHNAQKPLGRPQLEPIKSKTPSSRLPDLPSSAGSSSSAPTTPVTPASAFVSTNLPSKNHSRAYDEMVKSRNNNIYHQQQQQPNRQAYPQQKRQPYPQQQFEQQQRQQQLQQQYPAYKQNVPQSHQHHLPNQNQSHPQSQQQVQQLQQQRRNHKYGQMSPKDNQHRLPKAQNVYRNYSGPSQQQSPVLSPTDLQDANRINFLNATNQTSHSRNRYANDRSTLDTKRQLANERTVINDQKQTSPVDGMKKTFVNELDNMKVRNRSKDSGIGLTDVGEFDKTQGKLDGLESGEGGSANGKTTNKTNEIDTGIDKEKEKEKEGKSKTKSSFSSFFKIKRDKPRSASHAAESTEEPKLAFKVKRSLSHSSETGLSSPKTDFKSFFGGKKEKEKEKEKEQEKEREKEKSDSNSSSIMRKAHDGMSSSPKLGVGLFSSHGNLLSKNKSTDNVSESGNKKEKSESNILGFQHKHKKDVPDSSQKGRNLQHNRVPQRKESNTTLRKGADPVELKITDQNSIADESNESTLTNSLDEVEKSRLVNSNLITSTQTSTSPAVASPPGSNLAAGSDSVSTVVDRSVSVASKDEVVTSDIRNDQKIDSNALAVVPAAATASQGISIPVIAVNESVQPQASETTISPEAESNELIKRSLEETLQQNERPSKPNQPLEMRDSAFGFPLPPVSNSTLVMLDHRFPVQVERAIYRLSHLKLADPKRPLRQQVLLSNFMYSYLNLVNHTLWIQSKEQEGNENELVGTNGRAEMIMNGAAVTASETEGPLM